VAIEWKSDIGQNVQNDVRDHGDISPPPSAVVHNGLPHEPMTLLTKGNVLLPALRYARMGDTRFSRLEHSIGTCDTMTCVEATDASIFLHSVRIRYGY